MTLYRNGLCVRWSHIKYTSDHVTANMIVFQTSVTVPNTLMLQTPEKSSQLRRGFRIDTDSRNLAPMLRKKYFVQCMPQEGDEGIYHTRHGGHIIPEVVVGLSHVPDRIETFSNGCTHVSWVVQFNGFKPTSTDTV